MKTCTVVSELPDAVQAKIDDFFTDGVMTTGEVVSGIFFSSDELFWMEELSVGSGSDLIDNGWLEIEEDSSWDVLSGTSLGKEGVEGIITTTFERKGNATMKITKYWLHANFDPMTNTPSIIKFSGNLMKTSVFEL